MLDITQSDLEDDADRVVSKLLEGAIGQCVKLLDSLLAGTLFDELPPHFAALVGAALEETDVDPRGYALLRAALAKRLDGLDEGPASSSSSRLGLPERFNR